MIVLDTHVLIWWLSDPKRLPRRAERVLKTARRIGVPAISLWEFTMLALRGRIRVDRSPREWLHAALETPRVELLPLSESVAVYAASLAAHHRDPADSLIVATALVEGVPLVTSDARITDARSVEVIWR